MPRGRADKKLASRVIGAHTTLANLEADLRLSGDRELADAVKRARRELEHSSVSGALNQLEVKFDASHR